MTETTDNLVKRLTLRFKASEYDVLEKKCRKTTFRNLSEYCRALLAGEKITVRYRDSSLDEMIEELSVLRRELNAVGNNLNQAVRQINAGHGLAGDGIWMKLLTIISGQVEPKIKEIKEQMNKYSDQWSQKLKAERA